MSALSLLQSTLQRRILGEETAIEREVVEGDRFSARDRLAIYAHAYTARLVEALRINYPAVAHVLGEEQFDALAREFVARHPSHTASIRWFGRSLADFLEDRATEATGVLLADLARWEWALAAAFDGPDSQPMAINTLGEVPARHWPDLRFGFAHSLQRATLRTNAVEWWRFAVQHDDQPTAAIIAEPIDWVIWRAGLATSFRSTPHDEARMLESALHGSSFAELCADLAECVRHDDVALQAVSFVKSWCAAGWIVSCRW